MTDEVIGDGSELGQYEHEVLAERIQLGAKRLDEIAQAYRDTTPLDVSDREREALEQADALVFEAIDRFDSTFGESP